MSAITQPELCLEVAKLFPPKGEWSDLEYLLLNTNRLVELSDGSLEVLEMPTETHQDVSLFFYRELFAFVSNKKLGKVQAAPRPMRLWPGKFREPDVMFMFSDHLSRITQQFWIGADLVMEVVSEDRDHDLVKKRLEYARAGIPEYWIVDPTSRELSVLKLTGEQYQSVGVYRPGEQATSVLLPGFTIDVSAVFDSK